MGSDARKTTGNNNFTTRAGSNGRGRMVEVVVSTGVHPHRNGVGLGHLGTMFSKQTEKGNKKRGLTITYMAIRKEKKSASQTLEGDRKNKNQSTATLVPIEKITSTHKKQENNLVKRIRMLTIGRGLGLCIGLVIKRGYR